MFILGVSAYYHDSASCLIKNEKIIAAVQEERFTRKKHDASFPINAIEYCLQQANINSKDIDYVVFYEKPFLIPLLHLQKLQVIIHLLFYHFLLIL